MSTHRRRLVGADPNAGGYRTLSYGPGEPHVVRTSHGELSQDATHDAAGGSAGHPAGTAVHGEVLLAVAHLSDLHVCDAQSPARVEFLDRFADPDSPLLDQLDEVGTYRAQEMLTTHVVDAMVSAVNAVDSAPVTHAPLELAVVTGDLTDNAQANELEWYLGLLDGGDIHPDSGDPTRYEGVSDDVDFDERYWHPESLWTDLPRSKFGFPTAPGLLNSMRVPFAAPGLSLPWLTVHGNHDQLLQGTLPAAGMMRRFLTGYRKPIAVPADWSAEEVFGLLSGLASCDPLAIERLREAEHRVVTADRRRRAVSRAEFIAAHLHDGARPAGHGLSADSVQSERAHYRFDCGEVTFLAMDTVNDHGGWEGSIDGAQLAWVHDELTHADRDRRYVVLASHHPLNRMDNAQSDGSQRRVLGAELATMLAGHPSLVLWLNGHTHETTLAAHDGWWEVTAPSLIDWPQQARIVELVRRDGTLVIATTMLDHIGDAPWTGAVDDVAALAGLSRELAANDWQWRRTALESHVRGGRRADRNALLLLDDPFA